VVSHSPAAALLQAKKPALPTEEETGTLRGVRSFLGEKNSFSLPGIEKKNSLFSKEVK
jgi:hypothetical protein